MTGAEIFFFINQQRNFFFLFSDLYRQSTSPLLIRDPPHGHALKEMPTTLATSRRREPPQPTTKPCCARSLPIWRSPTAKPAAWGCRAQSLLGGHQNEFGWSPEFYFAKKGSPSLLASPSCFWLVAEILICLFGCCEKLIWVGVGYFWWEVIIKK